MISDYALKHLNMWFWFGALTMFENKEMIDSSFFNHYMYVAKQAQETASSLGANVNKLIRERKEESVK